MSQRAKVSWDQGVNDVAGLVQWARAVGCDLVIVGDGTPQETAMPLDMSRLLHGVPCWVALVRSSLLPEELDATPPEKQPAKHRV